MANKTQVCNLKICLKKILPLSKARGAITYRKYNIIEISETSNKIKWSI